MSLVAAAPERSAPPAAVAAAERAIARRFGRRHAVLLGSGTAALYCAFGWLRTQRSEVGEPAVLFPNVTCETAVNAAIFAGLSPRFCDVRAADAVLDPAAVRSALGDPQLVGVVPTHIYGHLADVREIERAFDRPLFAIEDAAQAYGGALGSAAAGGMGTASVVSFGDGKLLDCGGGGALLCDDDDVAAACRDVAGELPANDRAAVAERRQVMMKMIAARKATRGNAGSWVAAQLGILREHRFGYLARCTARQAAAIEAAWPRIESIVRARRELTARLDEWADRCPAVTLPERAGDPVLWRYTFTVDPAERDPWMDRLEAAGVSVSKLFPPCSRKFTAGDDAFPVSDRLARSVVNLRFPEREADFPGLLEAFKRVFH